MKVKNFFSLSDGVLSVKVIGEFDRDLALAVQEILDDYSKEKIDKIIFDISKLDFLASSGLRVFIYAKENVCSNVEVNAVHAKEIIKRVIKMSGINSIIEIEE